MEPFNIKVKMKNKTKKQIYNIIVSLFIVAGIVWVCSKFIHLGNVEHTDNAQIKQLIVPVNSRVQGFISGIYFDEYQNVKKGDTLAVIEDTEFVSGCPGRGGLPECRIGRVGNDYNHQYHTK